MAEDNNNSNSSDDSGDSNANESITLDSVVEVAVTDLNDDQKTFLRDNVGELSDEQKETYKEIIESEDEKEEINPDDVEIETRTETKEEEKKEPKSDDDEDIDPEDEKTISKVVSKELEDFRGAIDDVQKIRDEQEVGVFINNNPDFKPYRAVILKHLAHPAYKNIPVNRIAIMVAGDDLQKIGARKEREAAARANATKDTGATARTSEGKDTDWAAASKEAFEKKKNEVMGIPNE